MLFRRRQSFYNRFMAKYFVYVIELDPKVADHRKFRAKNPQYIKGNIKNLYIYLLLAILNKEDEQIISHVLF